MTIRKGEPWGERRPLPPGGVVVRSDGEARAVVTEARRSKSAVPPLGLLGGDLCRTLGGPGDETRLRSADAMTFPVDLGEVLLDGRLHYFVAHLVARGPLWLGPGVVVMNAAFVGDRNLGPKAHPNDGLLDITSGRLPPSQLLLARHRARLGTHLPHPFLHSRRVEAEQIRLDRPTPVRLDGHRVGRVRELTVRVEPDALTVVI